MTIDDFRPTKRPWIGAASSAILLALAFYGLWPLVFVALIPLFVSLRDATPRQAWNRGYAFGLLFSLTQLWWLGDLAYKWTGSAFLGIVPWAFAALLSAVYYGLLGRLVRACHGLNAAWAIPLIWAGMEIFRSYIPVLAFPWALLAEPLVGTPLRGLAWFGTVYLVSAFVVSVNVAILRRHVVGFAALIGVTGLMLGLWSGVFRSDGPANRVAWNLAAGQPGVDMAVPDGSTEWQIQPALDALSAEAAARHVGVLVLPEGMLRVGDGAPPLRVPDGLSLVVGGQRGTGPVFQSAYGYGKGRWTHADKTRLVIFGEFVPGRDFLPFLGAFHLPSGDLSAGDKLAQVDAGGWRVGPLICFEALFPDLGLRQAVLRPDFLAVMSIDDWFKGTPAPERLAQAARWRATEAGRPLVRAGSLGKSMIVGAQGEVLAEAPPNVRGLVVTTLDDKGRGPFPLVWLFPLAAAGSLVAAPLLARRRANSDGGVAATL